MERATAKSVCRTGLEHIGLFAASVILVGVLLSVLVRPWVDLSWWKILRRCASIAAAVSVWLIIRRVERRSVRSYGFSDWRYGRRQLLLGLGLGIGSLAVLFGLGLVTGICRIDVTADRMRLWRTLIGFVPGALLVAVLEELVFRGIVLQQLLACSRLLALGASSASYALVHVRTATLDLMTWLELGGLFLLGWVLSVSYLKTRQLFLAVGLHASLAYGARVNKLLVEFTDPSLTWLVGTSRLVNGVVGWIALIGLGSLIGRWVRPPQQGMQDGDPASQGGVRHGQS